MNLDRISRGTTALASTIDRGDDVSDDVALDGIGFTLGLLARERTRTTEATSLWTTEESRLAYRMARIDDGQHTPAATAATAAVDTAFLLADLRATGELEHAEALAGPWVRAATAIVEASDGRR